MLNYPLTLSFERFSFGRKIHILDAATQPLFYVRQRALALKEVVDVFAETAVSTSVPNSPPETAVSDQLYNIKADRILDYSATYTVADADGVVIGHLSRQGMRSRWRALYETVQSYRKYGWDSDRVRPIWDARYLIMDADGEEVGQILEEMPLMKLIGAIFSELLLIRPFLNPAYHIYWHGQPVLATQKLPAMFSRTFTLAQEGDFAVADEPLLLNSLVMALLIEKNLGI